MSKRRVLGTMMTLSLMMGSPAEARWREASSAHFVVYSEQSPEQLRRYADTLERYDALLQLLGTGASRLLPVPAG